MRVNVPADFMAHAAQDDGVVRWLTGLPKLIDSVLTDWALTPTGPVLTGQNAVVLLVDHRRGRTRRT